MVLAADFRPDAPTAPNKLLYTIPEAASALGISRSATYNLITDGSLRAIKLRGSTRIPLQSLHKLMEAAPAFTSIKMAG